jgi:3-methyladenine DNA glycosylase AlkD
MDTAELADEIEAGLGAASTPERREASARYLKTGLRVIGTATPPMRKVVREFAPQVTAGSADEALALALELVARGTLEGRQAGYELLAKHKAALAALTVGDLERLGAGMDNWATVDCLCLEVIGPCWLRGVLADEHVFGWLESDDVWWRRAAVVATTGLNRRTKGATGDVGRTLAVCERVVGDRHPMISKALSWALRVLGAVEPGAVWAFLELHEGELAAHVKREVRAKLETGRKSPRRGG